MPEGSWRVPLLLLAATCACWLVYNLAPPRLAELALPPYAAGLVLGPSLVYPILRRRDASARRAVLAALVVPAAWLLKEGWRITAVFSVPEAFYYAFNPLSLGLFTAAAFQMAAWELFVGRARRAPLTVLAVVALLAGGFGIATHDSGGREAFYAYIAIYRWLFGG